MIVVHHLSSSQSERVVWTCEELELPYNFVRHQRESTGAAPPPYKAMHFFGTAPIIQDGDLTMGESGAIVEYLCRKHANGRLTAGPSDANFADYLYWFHFANGTFVAGAMMAIAAGAAGGGEMTEHARLRRRRFERSFEFSEKRLGEAPYFAGSESTAADIMMVFALTRMRKTVTYDLADSPNIRAYLKRIGERPAYQRAMAKGDPGDPLKLT